MFNRIRKCPLEPNEKKREIIFLLFCFYICVIEIDPLGKTIKIFW